jgi:hypothetical protein
MHCADEPSDGDVVEGQAYFSNSEQVICHTFSTKSVFNQGYLMATMNTTNVYCPFQPRGKITPNTHLTLTSLYLHNY